MRRHIPGLNSSSLRDHIPEGRLLVAVKRILYIRSSKPYFAVAFSIEEPSAYQGKQVQTRLYCTERALWKLNWFLRDFGYDQRLFQDEEIDERAIIGLRGVISISRVSVNGRAFTNVDAFAPAATWEAAADAISPMSTEANELEKGA